MHAALTFLALNGVEIADPRRRLYAAMISLVEHRLDKPGFVNLLRRLAGAPRKSD